jgi:DNA ligase-1
LRNGLSSEPAAIPQAETLVMETTYGLPRYQFPPTEETLEAMIKFCHETLEEGETPVLFGYALGKAQEILAALQTAQLPVMLHGAIARIARVYEDFGVVFPPYVQFEAKASRGHVIICPPAVNGSRTLQLLHRPRTAALTGWRWTLAQFTVFKLTWPFRSLTMQIIVICYAMLKLFAPVACLPSMVSRRNLPVISAAAGSRPGH